MKSLANRVTLLGTLGKDAEITQFESGKKKATLSVATNESYKNDKGEKIETTDWHRVVLWGKQAEFAENYLKKGKRIALEGKLSTHSYEKEGQTKFITEVIANEVILLTPREIEELS